MGEQNSQAITAQTAKLQGAIREASAELKGVLPASSGSDQDQPFRLDLNSEQLLEQR